MRGPDADRRSPGDQLGLGAGGGGRDHGARTAPAMAAARARTEVRTPWACRQTRRKRRRSGERRSAPQVRAGGVHFPNHTIRTWWLRREQVLRSPRLSGRPHECERPVGAGRRDRCGSGPGSGVLPSRRRRMPVGTQLGWDEHGDAGDGDRSSLSSISSSGTTSAISTRSMYPHGRRRSVFDPTAGLDNDFAHVGLGAQISPESGSRCLATRTGAVSPTQSAVAGLARTSRWDHGGHTCSVQARGCKWLRRARQIGDRCLSTGVRTLQVSSPSGPSDRDGDVIFTVTDTVAETAR